MRFTSSVVRAVFFGTGCSYQVTHAHVAFFWPQPVRMIAYSKFLVRCISILGAVSMLNCMMVHTYM
jgi:hypothetical protein